MAIVKTMALLLCIGAAACANMRQQSAGPIAGPIRAGGVQGAPSDPNAWQRFTSRTPRRVTCGELPVLLEESRTSVTLTGLCGYVRVAGDHNDISVELSPGGTIEITGAHNDVSWKQPNASIPASLFNRGQSNSFHPPPKT